MRIGKNDKEGVLCLSKGIWLLFIKKRTFFIGVDMFVDSFEVV